MPTKINITETQLDEKLNNQESFIVYFGWYLCSDCSALATNFLNDYLLTKTNGKKIYYFEINDYRCLEGAEACDSSNPTYLALKEKYEWNFVPTLIYYENGKKTDMAVYYNDSFAEGSLRDWKESGMTVTKSYYNDLINQTFTEKEKYIEFHNNKVNEFLNTYLPKTN